MTVTHTRTHAYVGFANPFLVCEECRGKVPYWHDPDRCGPGCEDSWYHVPCGHRSDIISLCPTWNPVDGCLCLDKENHDKF